MPQRDIISWNTILFGFAGIRNTKFAQYLVDSMPERDVVSWNSMLSSCSSIRDYCFGLQVHCLASPLGFNNVVTTSALVDMYSKCKKLEITLQDTLKAGIGVSQLTYASAFRSCAGLAAFSLGQLDIIQLHGLTVICNSTFDICIANAILDMYGKCGGLVEACLIFDEMEKRDVISWNAIIVAHEQNEEIEKILSFFVSMLRQIVEPDDSTYGSVVKACAGLQALKYGMDIHGQIVNSGLESESFLGNFIVDMYCKCGMLEEVEKIHYRLDGQTMVLWNSMISRFSLQK
ncbi:Pentatricopeptide repeat-containing protein [Arachis hypogaea]|nr:Pentatricopeptide repeat-containing protein [Arachis hypogaea]